MLWRGVVSSPYEITFGKVASLEGGHLALLHNSIPEEIRTTHSHHPVLADVCAFNRVMFDGLLLATCRAISSLFSLQSICFNND